MQYQTLVISYSQPRLRDASHFSKYDPTLKGVTYSWSVNLSAQPAGTKINTRAMEIQWYWKTRAVLEVPRSLRNDNKVEEERRG